MNFLDPRLPERFWSKCIPEPNSGCWIWFAARCRHGYGRLKPIGDVTCLAHRLAFIASGSAVTDEQDLDHLCRNPSCVNPAHLEAVSHAENVRRGDHSQAQVRRRTQPTCIRGHAFDAKNTRIRANGRRACRECLRGLAQKYYAQRKAAHV